MPNTEKVRGNLRRDDHWRALLTDTSPAEVPIIFSNDGFYKNISNLSNYSVHFQHLLNTLLPEALNHTIPYRFNVVKDSSSYRQLSLLHPKSQMKISEFYRDFDQLITYYTSRSPFSIRFPEKVGSRYFFRTPDSDRNKYKNGTVDTTDIENIVRNPASYFSYGGYDRLYRFFSSHEFIRLEKKFSIMLTLDVGKCFQSIYTHSISWALKDKRTAKTYRSEGQTFGNRFDKLMQSINYNETNGICIGPEVSRVFAEIIMSKVDINSEKYLRDRGIIHMVDYECKRYVDNFYIFSNSRENIEIIQRVIALSLGEFNLHINDLKTNTTFRPFYTDKSNIINNANKRISKFVETLIETRLIEKNRISIPKWPARPANLVKFFIEEIKDLCYQSKSGYEPISNYVIAALSNRVIWIVESYTAGGDDTRTIINRYPRVFLIFFELMFFFFSMHPTSVSSLRVSRALVQAGIFLRNKFPESLEYLREHSLRWSSQLMTAPTFTPLMQRKEFVPIELLNILVSLRELSHSGRFEKPLIERAASLVKQDSYFDIVCRLYIFSDDPVFSDLRDELFQNVRGQLIIIDHLTQDSHAIHLLIDILSCPYISKLDRKALLQDLWPNLRKNSNTGLPAPGGVPFEKIIDEFEAAPWFVNWKNIDLLNLIEKKELSAVY